MPAGTPRTFEEREAELLRMLEDLKRKKRIAELREAVESDAVSQTLLATLKAVDRAFLVPDVAADETVMDVLRQIRSSLCERLQARGVPIEATESTDD